MLEVKEVNQFYGGSHILRDVSLSAPVGKCSVVLGRNGVGKTTLLKCLMGILPIKSGQILLDGKDIAKMSRSELFSARARMGMLFQSGALFTDMSVYENVAFPIRAHTKLPEHLIAEIVALKLESVGLRGAEQMIPSELSGGMNRRVALARAIALDPELIMYDEPFAGQDPIVMGVLTRLIRSLREALDLTTIIVSHDVAETLSIADYIYVVAEGKIQGEGTAEELKDHPSAFVQQFLTGSVEGPVDYQFSHQAYLSDEVRS